MLSSLFSFDGRVLTAYTPSVKSVEENDTTPVLFSWSFSWGCWGQVVPFPLLRVSREAQLQEGENSKYEGLLCTAGSSKSREKQCLSTLAIPCLQFVFWNCPSKPPSIPRCSSVWDAVEVCVIVWKQSSVDSYAIQCCLSELRLLRIAVFESRNAAVRQKGSKRQVKKYPCPCLGFDTLFSII